MKIVAFVAFCAFVALIIFLAGRKASLHLKLKRLTDARFDAVYNAADLISKSYKYPFMYLYMFYAYSPFYFESVSDKHKELHDNVKRYSLYLWISLAVMALQFLINE